MALVILTQMEIYVKVAHFNIGAYNCVEGLGLEVRVWANSAPADHSALNQKGHLRIFSRLFQNMSNKKVSNISP